MKRKVILLTIIIVAFLIIICGCEQKKSGYIVRHDIDKKETEYLYENMSSEEILQVFGLPHKTNTAIITTYYYNTKNFVLQLDMYNGGRLSAAKLYEADDVKNFELPKESIQYINKESYKDLILYNIPKENTSFISEETTSKELQEKFGAPYTYREYKLESGATINAFTYSLKDNETLNILYTYYGAVGRVWIEDSKCDEKEVLVEVEETVE